MFVGRACVVRLASILMFIDERERESGNVNCKTNIKFNHRSLCFVFHIESISANGVLLLFEALSGVHLFVMSFSFILNDTVYCTICLFH